MSLSSWVKLHVSALPFHRSTAEVGRGAFASKLAGGVQEMTAVALAYPDDWMMQNIKTLNAKKTVYQGNLIKIGVTSMDEHYSFWDK